MKDFKGELREHQKKAADQLSNGKILWGGVGSGKTIASLAYYMMKEAPRDLYVVTTAKKRDSLDWEKEAGMFGISKHHKEKGRGLLHVNSWQMVKHWTDVEGAFFIFDEQHVSGSGTWSKAFIKIAKKNHWIVLSGTPGDTWSDYVSIFIAAGFYKSRTQFEARHTVKSHWGGYPKIERYLEESYLYKLRDSLLVEMPFERHTTRHTVHVEVNYDRDEFKHIIRNRNDPETGEPYPNAAALVHALRKVGNADESRIAALDAIYRTKSQRLIIFYNFDYELEMLREWAAGVEGLQCREWNGKKHEEIPEDGDWVYLVQYMGAEAWNCITTDSMVFFSLTYSYKIYEQCMGRTDRLNTPYTDLYYYVLRNNGPIDVKIWKALRMKKNFNETTFRSWLGM